MTMLRRIAQVIEDLKTMQVLKVDDEIVLSNLKNVEINILLSDRLTRKSTEREVKIIKEAFCEEFTENKILTRWWINSVNISIVF